MDRRLIDPLALGLEVVRFFKNGEEALVSCPYHADRHPSATFNVKLGLFHCFSCGTSKNALQLMADLDGDLETFDNFAAFVAAHKIKLHEDESGWEFWLTYPLAINHPYLKRRGVPNWQVKEFGIRGFKDGVIFPITDFRNRITGVQIRWTKGDRRYTLFGKRSAFWPAGKLREIWPGAATGRSTCFIVEGIFGVLRLTQFKSSAIAVMGAAALGEMVQIIGSGHGFFGVFDADDAGFQAAAKLAMCGIPSFKNGCETDELEDIGPLLDPKNFTDDPEFFAQKHSRPEVCLEQAIRFRRLIYAKKR